MKWVVFAAALLVGLPAMVLALRAWPLVRRWILPLFFLLLMNDLGSGLAINLVSYEAYRGWSRGLEVTGLDVMGLGLAVYVWLQPASVRARVKGGLLEERAFLLFASMVVLNVVAAQVPLYAAFGGWKLLRGVGIYFLFSALLAGRHQVGELMVAFGLVCLVQLPVVAEQKYLLGAYRATGTLPHMNTLAMGMNMLSLPVFATLWLGDGPPRAWQAAAVAAAAFNVLATASRGALVSMVACMAATFAFVRSRDLSVRRAVLFAGLALAALLGGLKATDTVVQRFLTAPVESEETRVGFNVCAAAMARDFVLGVGLNNYSYMLGHSSYGDAAPDLADGSKDDGVCHHIYWLMAAETGWLGLLSFLGLLVAVQWRAFRLATRGGGPVRALGAGIFCGLLALHLQGFLEWILVQTNVWFLFCAQAGALSGAWRRSVGSPGEEPRGGLA